MDRQEQGTFPEVSKAVAASRQPVGLARWLTLLMAVVWAGFVLYLGSVSRVPRVPLISEDAEASLGHFGTHLVLGMLLYMLASPAMGGSMGRLRAVALAVGATLALGIGIEVVQVFVPERSPDPADVGYDALGAAIGVLAFFIPDQLKVSRRLLYVVANTGAAMAVAFVTAIIVVQALGLLRVERCHWDWLSYPLPCLSLESRQREHQAWGPSSTPALAGPVQRRSGQQALSE